MSPLPAFDEPPLPAFDEPQIEESTSASLSLLGEGASTPSFQSTEQDVQPEPDSQPSLDQENLNPVSVSETSRKSVDKFSGFLDKTALDQENLNPVSVSETSRKSVDKFSGFLDKTALDQENLNPVSVSETSRKSVDKFSGFLDKTALDQENLNPVSVSETSRKSVDKFSGFLDKTALDQENLNPVSVSETSRKSVDKFSGFLDKTALDQKYAFLNGADYPSWTDFKKANIPEWDSLDGYKKSLSYDYWKRRKTDFLIEKKGLDPEDIVNEFDKQEKSGGLSIERKLIDDAVFKTDIAKIKQEGITEGIPAWLYGDTATDDSNFEKGFDQSFAAVQAGKAVNNLNSLAKQRAEIQLIHKDVFTDGKPDPVKIDAKIKSIQEDIQSTESGLDEAEKADYGRDILGLTALKTGKLDEEIVRNSRLAFRLLRVSDYIYNKSDQGVKDFNSAQDWKSAIGAVFSSPGSVVSNLVGQALAQQLDALPETIIGGTVGATLGLPNAGAAIGGGLASAKQEEYSLVTQGIQEAAMDRKLDLRDPKTYVTLAQDQSFIEDVERKAKDKGISTGVATGVLNAISHGLLKRFSKIAGTGAKGLFKKAALNAGLSMTSGASGEAIGQEYAYGEIKSAKDILAEGLSDVGALAAQSAVGKFSQRFTDRARPGVQSTEQTGKTVVTKVDNRPKEASLEELESNLRSLDNPPVQDAPVQDAPVQDAPVQEQQPEVETTKRSDNPLSATNRVSENPARVVTNPFTGSQEVTGNTATETEKSRPSSVEDFQKIKEEREQKAEEEKIKQEIDPDNTSGSIFSEKFFQEQERQKQEAIDAETPPNLRKDRPKKPMTPKQEVVQQEEQAQTQEKKTKPTNPSSTPESQQKLLEGALTRNPQVVNTLESIDRGTHEIGDIDSSIDAIRNEINTASKLPYIHQAPLTGSLRQILNHLTTEKKALEKQIISNTSKSLSDPDFKSVFRDSYRAIGQETSPIEKSKGKPMSIQESFKRRQNEGGFVNFGIVADAAVEALSKASDFVSWGKEMVSKLGSWVSDKLEDLWNHLKEFSKFFQSTEFRDKQLGAIDVRRSQRHINEIGKDRTSVNTGVHAAFDAVNPRHLSPESRKEFVNLAKAKAESIKGKAPAESSDVIKAKLEEMRKESLNNFFAKKKENYPEVLKDKTVDDFQSERDIVGYINSKKVDSKKPTKEEIQKKRKDSEEKKARETWDQSLKNISIALDTDAYKKAPKEIKRDYAVALTFLSQLKFDELSKAQREQFVSLINSMKDGDFIGGGKVLAYKFAKENGVAIASLGDSFFGGNRAYGNMSQNDWLMRMSGEETLRRAFFTTDQAKDVWNKTFGYFVFDGINNTTRDQNIIQEKIESLAKKHGLTNNPERNARLAIAGLMLQYPESSDEPNAFMGRMINDIGRGLQNLVKQGDKIEMAKYWSSIYYNDFIKPLLDSGAIVRNDQTQEHEIAIEPDYFASLVKSQLTESEVEALSDIVSLFDETKDKVKHIQEFYYGREFKPWMSYFPRQALSADSENNGNPDGIELDSTTSARFESNDPIAESVSTSILNPRRGLTKGQYYNLDILTSIHRGMSNASYEINTAPIRFALKELMSSEDVLNTWGEENTKGISNVYKRVHQKQLGIGTTPRSEGFKQDLLRTMGETAIRAFIGHIIGNIKNGVMQLAAPLMTYVMISPDYYGVAFDATFSKRWTKFINDVDPHISERAKISNPLFDDVLRSGAVNQSTDIVVNGKYKPATAEEKLRSSLIYTSHATDKVSKIPQVIGKVTNQYPDAYAARGIFASAYIKYIIDNKIPVNGEVITSPSQFNPETADLNRDAAIHAVVEVKSQLGNPSSVALRAQMFNFHNSNAQKMWVTTVYSLASVSASNASDTLTDVGLVFNNIKNKEQRQKQKQEALHRIGKRLAGQSVYILAGYHMAKFIAFSIAMTLVAPMRGLDDEEKAELIRKRRIAKEYINGTRSAKMVAKELVTSIHPVLQNAIASGVVNDIFSYGENQIKLEGLKDALEVAEERYNSLGYLQLTEKKELKEKIEEIREAINIVKSAARGHADTPGVFGLTQAINETFFGPEHRSEEEIGRIAEVYAEKTKTQAKKHSYIGGKIVSGLGLLSKDISNANSLAQRAIDSVASKRLRKLSDQEKEKVKNGTN